MATHSTSKHNDLASIYVTTRHAHPSNAIIFMHFNGVHNTLFATGSSKHANPHAAAMFIDDHCVGSAKTIRNWNVHNDGTLFIDNSNLSNSQSTIQGMRVEQFPKYHQRNFRRLLQFLERRLSEMYRYTYNHESWTAVADSASSRSIAGHRNLSSIRALLDFAGHLDEVEGDWRDGHWDMFLYSWAEELGTSEDAAEIAVWDKIRAAWYFYYGYVDPKAKKEVEAERVEEAERRRMELADFVSFGGYFSKELTESDLMEDVEGGVDDGEVDGVEDDSDMMALQGGMERLRA